MLIAAAQPSVDPHDFEATIGAHAAIVRVAGARLVVFPELSLTGYELDAPAVDPVDPRLEPLLAACREAGSLALVGAPVAGDFIAMLAVDGAGVSIVYRKVFLGGDEPARFTPGPGPAVLDVDGIRVGLGICKDTGVPEHVDGMAALDLDLYCAGVCHLPSELDEQERRARWIASATGAVVALASFAGPTGPPFSATAGHSGIWSPAGTELAKTGDQPGTVATATL